MSFLEKSETDKKLAKYYKRLDGFNNKAIDKAEGDIHKYLGYFLDWATYATYSDTDLGEVCIETLKKGVKEKDYPLMQAAMNFMNKSDILWNLESGYDHSYMAYHIVSYLSSAEYESLSRAFPRGLPLASNGNTMNVHAANLILCMLYKDDYDIEMVIDKARKYTISKQSRWDRAFVACLLGILEQDTDIISENIQVLCELLARTDVTGFEKLQCQFAYGMLVIAYHNLPADKYELIRMPEYKNFDPGYMEWLLRGELAEEKLIEFRSPYELLNILMLAPISVTRVHQTYLNEDVPARQKKQFFMDCDSMHEKLIQYVMKNGINVIDLNKENLYTEEVKMKDEVFGEIEYDEELGYIGHTTLTLGGIEQSVEVQIGCDDDEEISKIQCDAFQALIEGWDEMQHKIAAAILEYYNEEEKGAYGPEDEDEFESWWPNIDTEEELVKRLHLDSIVIESEFVMESHGENPVYILFNRDWGGEDTEDNGVAVLIEDGEVTEVGYKDIAF
jgi:hypothetical protein